MSAAICSEKSTNNIILTKAAYKNKKNDQVLHLVDKNVAQSAYYFYCSEVYHDIVDSNSSVWYGQKNKLVLFAVIV